MPTKTPAKLKLKVRNSKHSSHMKQKLSEGSAFTEIFKSTTLEQKQSQESKGGTQMASESLAKSKKQRSTLFGSSSQVKGSLGNPSSEGSFNKFSNKSRHERGK